MADQGPDPDIHMRLSLNERTGAIRDYGSFTRRDAELAGEGLSSGKYTAVALFMGLRYIYLQAGNQMDVFDEDFSQWKDVTKKLEKQIKDKKKE